MAKAKEDFIYVLQLANGKWYVGRSSDPASRIRRHQAGCGSSWTKRYAPIEVVSVSAGDGFEESKRTLELMSLHGIDNVRGGRFCQVVLAEDDIYFLEMELRHASDRCLRCGRAGHFMRFCRAKSEVASVPPDSVVAPAAQQDDEEEEDEKEQEEKSGDDAASASNAELQEQLRALRRALATRDRVPGYVIFTNAMLRQIATVRPTTEDELRSIPGMGPQRISRYSADILSLFSAAPSPFVTSGKPSPSREGEGCESPAGSPEHAALRACEEAAAPTLYDGLAAYRLSEARAQQMPPYCILHNSVLQKIASVRPSTLDQLIAVPGMGPTKVQKYGAAILQIIREHMAAA